MPRYDGTGPMGAGPAAGRGQGKCVQGPGMNRLGDSGAGYEIFRRGRFGGLMRGRCLGLRGWWRNFAGKPENASDEARDLKSALDAAKAEIAAMEARLAELQKNE